jgi:hypothetical protein
MTDSAVALLTQNIKHQLAHLTLLREYHKKTGDPDVKSALALALEDVQEGIARVASRLRQLGHPWLEQKLDQAGEKLVWQSQGQRGEEAQLKFVRHGLEHQLDWYHTHLKDIKHDPDSQAIFVALAEQTRVRLERWENLMRELKVSLD